MMITYMIVIAIAGFSIDIESIALVLCVPLLGACAGSITSAFYWGGAITGAGVTLGVIIGAWMTLASEFFNFGAKFRGRQQTLSLTALLAFRGLGAGFGFALRALIVRVAATIVYLPSGIKWLPENWRENHFLTDSTHPAELMPGIRKFSPEFTSDGLTRLMIDAKNEGENKYSLITFFPIITVIFFLPVFLYRLNIKATAWFWWPLAYLLKPCVLAGTENQQKQALCWPWTNPFQKLLIGVSVLLVLASLILHYLNVASWSQLQSIPALSVALKILLAMDWSHITPWHWAQWVIACSGLGMFFLAGNARSHDVNGNWTKFRASYPTQIRVMTGLQRLRTLATIALLLMGLGALFIQQSYMPLPPAWNKALKDFYQVSNVTT